MLVGNRMTSPCITISPDTPVGDALAQMKKDKVRRYPVVDKHGKLVGIVSLSDLLNAQPSEATTLSVWEINYLLSKITVERVMAKEVITVTEDTPIEEAARIMADHKIGGLPVVRGDSVMGIITETNLFKVFLEQLGARTSGVRITLLVKDVPGKLVDITSAIHRVKGNLISVTTFLGETSTDRTITLKVNGASLEALRAAVEPLAEKVVDIREMHVG